MSDILDAMADTLDEKDIRKLAELAKLKLTDIEVARYQKELSSILSYVQQLGAVDTSNVKPTHQVTGLASVMRPDIVLEQPQTSEELLALVPRTQGRYIQVSRMI